MAHESLAEVAARTQPDRAISFGDSAVAVIVALRSLADAIERDAIVIMRAEEIQTLAPDEFTTRRVVVDFADKKEF